MNIFTLTNIQLFEIIKRFHSKFYKRKINNNIRINPNILPNIHNIKLISAYKNLCSYSGNKKNNIYKKYHIIIKYILPNINENEYICLNILYDDYKDIFSNSLPILN